MKNNEIKAVEVRLVTDSGNQVMKTTEAIEIANNEGLDLIVVSDGDIPVCKIGDYSKYLYDLKKKEKESKKKNKAAQIETKEIHISDSIEVHDLKTKAKMIDKFLSNKDKVRLVIRYRGRAIAHINEGGKNLENLTSYVTVPFNIDSPSKINGNQVAMVIAPKN